MPNYIGPDMIGTPLDGGYGCVMSQGFFAQEIRYFTHSKFNHAFIVLDAKSDLVLEAGAKGAQITTSLWRYRRMTSIYSKDVVLEGSKPALIAAAQPYIGIPYGFLDIALLGLAYGAHWRPKWLLEAVCDQRTAICSQLVAQFGVQNGALSWQCGQKDPQLVVPGMLADRILKSETTESR